MKKRYKVMSLIMLITILFISTSWADDNAQSGNGGSSTATRAYYRYSEYMYKVSIFVGLRDTVNTECYLDGNFKMIGDIPIYIKPAHFKFPSKSIGTNLNKMDFIKGAQFNIGLINSNLIIDNPPPPPITNGGDIREVKSYFGDTETLNALIKAFADQKGTTREGLVSGLNFTIDGETKNYPPSEILPNEVDGEFQNKVPWVIVYEPVIISYLKDKTTILAFTATEYAIAQKKGYFDFKYGDDGQQIAKMTHSDLPSSVTLNTSWFNYPAMSSLGDNVLWSENRIINGGGWGMRFLKANGKKTIENDIKENEYRVNTDVITSVRVFATGDDITPDNRHKSKSAYRHPSCNTATVSMNVNGYTKNQEVVIPSGGSQLVWIKWHTPLVPTDEVQIKFNIFGNSSAKIDGKYRSRTVKAKVVEIVENTPPDPQAKDEKPSNYKIPNSLPKFVERKTANWGEYDATWNANWVFYKDKNSEDEEDGEWVDEGEWDFDYTSYSLHAWGEIHAKPDEKCPTAIGQEIKSGYGIEELVKVYFENRPPDDHVTKAQTVLSYYPEFYHKEYFRILERKEDNVFQLRRNKYSTYNVKNKYDRVHFTPLWYPDGAYKLHGTVQDIWTPDGQLYFKVRNNKPISIKGNVYQDYHIGPIYDD